MDAAPPAFDLAHDAPAAFHAAYGSVLTAAGDALPMALGPELRAVVARVNPHRYLSA